MATAREEKIQGGFGKIGKFTDQRLLRKSPAKPYDRPPTDIRTSGRSNSWILKFVDPAQRLVSSGSQMLVSSVFRNLPRRLTSCTSAQGDNRNRSDRFGMMELEKNLRQTTFTRSEIDHLTALLHSRTVDLPVVNEEKRFEFISSMPEFNHGKEEVVKIPTSEVRMGRQSISIPILSSSVLDEDISSPAEIARAYMGRRRPKVGPSMRSLRAQGLGENAAAASCISLPSKSTDMLLVPTSTRQGLKRGSSCLDNDFGSIIPLRRFRRKPNILPSKGLGQPVSSGPISVPVNGLCFQASRSYKFGDSIRNSQLSLQPKKNLARKFIMNVDGDNIHGACSSSIYTPSRSYEMASKILEQLDKLTPLPKDKVSEFNLLHVGEKSPPKLSLRSLEVDLPKNEEFVDDNKRSNGLHGILFHDNRDHSFQKQEKMENMKPLDPHHGLTALVKDSGVMGSCKDSMTDLGVPAPAVVKSTIQLSKNKWAFQIWPDKDSLDHDESSAESVGPAMSEVGEEGDISSVVRQTTATEAKLQNTSEVIVGSPLNISSNLKTFDDPIDDEKDTSFTFQNASSLCTTSQQETIDSAPTHSFEDKDLLENKQSEPSVFSFGNDVSPRKQPNASSTLLDVGNKVASLTESRASAASENGNKAPYTQCNAASSYSDVQEAECNAASSYSDVQEAVLLNAHTFSNHKLDRSCRTCNDAFSSSTPISAGLAFSFSSSASIRSLNNGPSISCPSLFSSYRPPTASTSQSSSRNIFLSATSARNSANIIATDNIPSSSNLAPLSAPSTTSLHDANDPRFSSISTPANAPYSMFSCSAAAMPSSVHNQLSTPTVSSATEVSAQEASAGKEFAANNERTSIILGSSVLLASSGLAGKASVSSSISFGNSFPTTSTPLGFESSAAAPSSSMCSTTSAAALADSSSKPVSSNSHPTVAFRFSSGNNDCEEQTISKDNVPFFSQKPISPPSSDSSLNPFESGKQQTLAEPQNSSPFKASSLGADGGDGANRRFLKVKRKK